MTDKDLLERAAAAAEFPIFWSEEYAQWQMNYLAGGYYEEWNPLTDDGEALRLSAHLCMNIRHEDPSAVICGWTELQRTPITHDGKGPWFWKEWLRDHGNDRAAATRRAIVRAAEHAGSRAISRAG